MCLCRTAIPGCGRVISARGRRYQPHREEGDAAISPNISVSRDVGPRGARISRTVPSCRRKSHPVAFRHQDGPVRFACHDAGSRFGRSKLAARVHPRMTKKLLYLLVVAALASIAVVSFALPATAEQRTFRVKLSDGSVITVTVDAACGALPALPGHVVSEVPGACSTPALPTQPSAPADPTTVISPGSGGSNGGSNG